MDIQKTIKAVAKQAKAELPSGYRVLLFGSWAEGNARPGSDIDIVDFASVSERFRIRAMKYAKKL